MLGPTGGGACRDLATQFSAVATSANGFTSTTTSSCAFDASTRQVQCTHQYSDNLGQSSVTVGVVSYLSVADFVDEVAVVPPRIYALTGSSTQTGAAGTFGNSIVYSFDSERRVTGASHFSSVGSVNMTYTAWDAAGRPTQGTDVGPGYNNTLVISYDPVARTRTTAINGGTVTTVETFDANGNLVRQSSSSGGVTATSVVTVTATQRVCK